MAKSSSDIINPRTPSLAWLNYLMQLVAGQQISMPKEFREKVICIQDLLKNDESGLINSLLDLSIASANVDISIESNNQNFSEVLNNWLDDINGSLRGRVPTGIKNLAKQYYNERWKNSSFIVLRTVWENIDGIVLPTKMWFCDGKDIKIDADESVAILGGEKYKLQLTENKALLLPSSKNELIFVQKPFESWGADYPTPYLFKRGVYYNAQFLAILNKKGSNVLGKAIEYMLLMKKGNKDLALTNRSEFIYSDDDLKKNKEAFNELAEKMRTQGGLPTYFTNFDTEMEELIPDYKKALSGELYHPVEKRILSGLGFLEVIEGISTRRDAILNPRTFIAEVKNGVSDFKSLLGDVFKTILEKNKSHKKWINTDMIQVRSSAVNEFFTEDAKQYMRSLYDRGTISKRTLVEVTGDTDFDAEVERRRIEQPIEKLMFPPVIQNQVATTAPGSSPAKPGATPDKQGPEKRNFTKADEELLEEGQETEEIYEEAPYKTNKDLPIQLKGLPSGAQTIWRKTFNAILKKENNEDMARKIAWRNVELKYKKNKEGNWVLKTSSETAEALRDIEITDILELKKLEIMKKQSKLLDTLLENNNENPQ